MNNTHDPHHHGADGRGHHLAPSGADIAALCSAIAGADIPADADLFLSGLSSLDLVRVIGALEHGFGVRLTAVDFLDHPTAQLLAAHLTDRADGDRHG